MERYRANDLGTPIGRRDITGGHGASRDDQRQGFTKLDADSDAVTNYIFGDDGVEVQQAQGLLRRGPGNADDDGDQFSNDNPMR